MTWLYGDSSTSRLEINFIEFLKLAIDFSVEVLLAEEQIDAGREGRYRLEGQAEEELDRLEALGASVAAAADAGGAPETSAVARCAAAIRRAATAALKGEVSSVKAVLADQVAKIDAHAARERERCVRALESLLMRYDLPETAIAIQVEPTGSAYSARLRGATAYGLETVLELEIPGANPFAHEVRVDRFLQGLEVKVPEVGGWLRKQSRLVPHRLGKHRIVRLSTGAGEMRVELRVGAEPHATGFDVVIAGQPPAVTLVPIDKETDEKGHVPFAPNADDTAKLLQLSERLAGALAELAHSRRTMVEARLDGEPLQTHARPSLLIERLIGAIAPSVREIGRYSLSPGELVLRRLLGGDRREEVFVSKAELAHKLDALPPARRGLFEPLGLEAEPEPEAGAGEPEPEPEAGEPEPEAEPGAGGAEPASRVAAETQDEAETEPEPEPERAQEAPPVGSEEPASAEEEPASGRHPEPAT